MSRPKKKQKAVMMSKTKMYELEKETLYKVLVLSAGYLMDEFDYSDEAIIDYWDGIIRYFGAIDQKLITLDKVRNIIEEHTGLKIIKKY